MERSRRPYWLIAAVSTLILMTGLAACRPTASDDIGHLTGTVYTMGGKNAETNPAEATLTATPTSGDTSRTYTTETASGGSFSLDLPAGTYQLTGTLTTRIGGGHAGPEVVTITAGQTTSVDVFSIYP